jgi:hypothetical protein
MEKGLKKSITLKSNRTSVSRIPSSLTAFDTFLLNVCVSDPKLIQLNKWSKAKPTSVIKDFRILSSRINIDVASIPEWICTETKKTGNDKYYIFVNTEKYKTTNDIKDLFENNDQDKVFIQRFNVSSGNVEQVVVMHDFNDSSNIKFKKLWELICANIS